MPLQLGSQLGNYTIVARIGSGGMGEVYRAHDARLGRDVAIKVLPSAFAEDAERLRRFEQEARATGGLNHPNIISVFDVGTQEGSPYLVMELLEGETLRSRLEGKALPLKRSLEIARSLAQGLAVAHEKGIVHRDLKPENIFLTKDGRVKILDFGLAKAHGALPNLSQESVATAALEAMPCRTEPGMLLGTVGYMSPEQVRGDKLDARSDLFSLGVVLWEMATGNRPFRGGSQLETLHAILKEEPPELDLSLRIPPVLERILRVCLAKDPADRFHSAHDLAFALETAAGSSALEAGQVPALAPTFRRTRLAGLAMAAGGLLVGALAAGFLRPSRVAPSFHQLTFARGYLGSAARFLPGGRSIIYSAGWRGQPLEVYTQSLEGLEARKTGLRDADLLGVSPGEELLVRRNPRGDRGMVVRTPLSAGGAQNLGADIVAADFQGHESIVVIRKGPEGFTLEWPLGERRYQTGNPIQELHLSHDGQRVAWLECVMAQDHWDYFIKVASRGGAQPVTLAAPRLPGLANPSMIWAPDDQHFWMARCTQDQSEILELGLHAASRPRMLWRGPGRLTLLDSARDGRTLVAFERSRTELWGLGPGQTVEQDFSWFDHSLGNLISLDAHYLWFTDRTAQPGSYAFYRRDLKGGEVVRDDTPVVYVAGEACPTGERVLGIPDQDRTRIDLLSLDATPPRSIQVTGIDELFDASAFPAEDRAVVGFRRGRTKRLGIVSLLKSGPVLQEFEEGFTGVWPTLPVAPDGASLLAERRNGTQDELWVLPMDGRPGRLILSNGLEGWERVTGWGADGHSVFVHKLHEPNPMVQVLDLKTGLRRPWLQIKAQDPIGVQAIRNIHFSRDGKNYFYNIIRRLDDLFLVEGLE